MKRMLPIYILQLATVIALVLVLIELRGLRTMSAELTGIKQQMATPQGLRPARAGGGIPVYITDGPPVNR